MFDHHSGKRAKFEANALPTNETTADDWNWLLDADESNTIVSYTSSMTSHPTPLPLSPSPLPLPILIPMQTPKTDPHPIQGTIFELDHNVDLLDFSDLVSDDHGDDDGDNEGSGQEVEFKETAYHDGDENAEIESIDNRVDARIMVEDIDEGADIGDEEAASVRSQSGRRVDNAKDQFGDSDIVSKKATRKRRRGAESFRATGDLSASTQPNCYDSKYTLPKKTTGDDHWMKMYNRLVAYTKIHKSTRVSEKADPKLANWVCTQRKSCKKKDRVDILNNIGFVWDCRQIVDKEWMKMYDRLVAYNKKHGTTCVPKSFKADPKLAKWVSYQRCTCKKKGRVDILNKIGFEWQLTEKMDWMEMYARLVAHKKKHGTTCVPRSFEKDPKLANWVCTQRQSCKEKDKVDLLNNIGFVWSCRDNRWMEMYNRLVAYKKKYGTTYIAQAFKKDLKLAKWVCRQRQSCKKKNRVDLLNDIGFVWDAENYLINRYIHSEPSPINCS